jgi:hypothetical protein
MSDTTPTEAELETQRATAALIGGIEVRAPASLHYAVRELTDGARRSPQGAWSGRPLLAGAVGSLAAMIAVLVLLLGSGGGESAPTVLQASALTQRPATQSAPSESTSAPGHLAISAAGITYPYWGARFGWHAAGARVDTLGGRTVTTVFYSSTRAGARRQIGYSIVGGPALAIPTAGHAATWHGVPFQVLRSGGATLVTWRRAGHTCILVGSGVSSHTLLTLANWKAT